MLARQALWSGTLSPGSLRVSIPLHRTVRYVSSRPPLVRIQDGTFYRQYPTADDVAKGQNAALFPNLTFELPTNAVDEPKQHWAVIGTGGRKTLLDIFRGRHICLPPTARSYPYLLTDEIGNKEPRLRVVENAIQYAGFTGDGAQAIGGTRGAYLSARYESHREETDWTLHQFLKGQTSLNPLEGDEEGSLRDDELLSQVVSDLRLGELLDMPAANLSNGQTRRARIAKALLSRPELLLLDEPFMGLDPATVRGISNLLHGLAEKCAPRLMLGLRPQDEVPEWITHLLILANPSEILLRGTKEHIDQELDVWRGLSGGGTRPEYAQWEKKIQERLGRNVRMDRQFFFDLDIQRRINRVTLKLPAVNEGEPLIEMDGVRVQYGDKPVLGDWEEKIGRKKRHGLHWTVRRGQRWAILGANGSGKTTLLSLITSDHPQAYALPIKIFGRSRLPSPGEPAISVFELQSRMGHSSPEIHAVFPRQLTIRQAVESAFAEAFHSRPNLDCERDDDVTAALRFFKPELDVNKQASPPMTDAEVTVKRGGRPPKFDPTDPVPTGAIPTGFVPTDDDVDYADETRFGDLNTAQQRVVLLLRAIIHKPDIIILDEAFSGMPPSVRDKCIHFLEAGEQPIEKGVTARRRLSNQATWIAGHNQKKNVGRGSTKPGEAEDVDDESAMRHFGLSDRQALIVVSHVKDEIPDCVRDYLRLPSDPGDGMPLEFGQGRLRRELAISSPNTWRILWSPKLQFSNNPAGRNTKPGVEKSPTTGPNATEERSMTPDAIRMRRLRESRESTSQRVFSMTPDAVRKRKRRQLLKALREAETRQEGKV